MTVIVEEAPLFWLSVTSIETQKAIGGVLVRGRDAHHAYERGVEVLRACFTVPLFLYMADQPLCRHITARVTEEHLNRFVTVEEIKALIGDHAHDATVRVE